MKWELEGRFPPLKIMSSHPGRTGNVVKIVAFSIPGRGKCLGPNLTAVS
jgi:hypothetical protein